GRELFQRPEEGADQAADLPISGRRGIGCVRLHRDVLQPDPPAWFRWRHVTGRVREALRATQRLSVYGNLVGPSWLPTSNTNGSRCCGFPSVSVRYSKVTR